MKSPKQSKLNSCSLHNQKYQFICLHNNCQHCFKLLCSKCKKEKHYQHPNRVLQLKQFYKITHKNHLNFVQNSLCMELINLKDKIIHVSNFRAFILEKQADLMQSTKIINQHLLRILHEKQQISGCLFNLSEQNQLHHTELLSSTIGKLQKSVTYNPINGLLSISPQKIRSIKIQLQKCYQSTVTVINDLRQYLIKIIQVLLSQEIQQEEIDYFQEGNDDEKTFNIQIKKPTSVQTNLKQPKYKIEQISSLYSKLLKEQFNISQQLQNDVKLLQEQIRVKTEIVNNIRRRSYSNQPRQLLNDVDSINEKELKSQSKSKTSHKNQTGQNNVKVKDSPKSIINEKTPKAPKIRSITQTKNQNSNKNIQTPKSPKNNIMSPKPNRNNNLNQQPNSRANKQQNANLVVFPQPKNQLPKQIKQESFKKNQSSNESLILRHKIQTLQKQVSDLRKSQSQTLQLVQTYRIAFNDDKLQIQQKVKGLLVLPLDIKVQSPSIEKELGRLKRKVQQLKASQKKYTQQREKKLKQIKIIQQKVHKAQQKSIRLEGQLKKQKQQASKNKKISQDNIKRLQCHFQELKKQNQTIKDQKQKILKQANKNKNDLQNILIKLSEKQNKLQQLQRLHDSTHQESSRIMQSLRIQNKQLNFKLLERISNFQQKNSANKKNNQIQQDIQQIQQENTNLKEQYSNLEIKYHELNEQFKQLKEKQAEEQGIVKNQLKNNSIILQQGVLLQQFQERCRILQESINQLTQKLKHQLSLGQDFQIKLATANQKIIDQTKLIQKVQAQIKIKQLTFLKVETQLKGQIKDISSKYKQLKAVLQRKKQQKLQDQQQIISKSFTTQANIPMLNLKSSVSPVDMNNYVQMRKFKQTREMLQISIRKNNNMKFTLDELTQQIQKIKKQNDLLRQKAQQRNKQIDPSIDKNQQTSSSVHSIDYQQVKSLINALTSDVALLQEKVKENAIIEKVYLKQLDRKRTQNRKLRQYVQELTNKQRQFLGIQTDRHFQKLSQKAQGQFKVHYATGFVGSGSRISSSGNSVVSGMFPSQKR